MRELVPFRLDPIFKSNLDLPIQCAECGKTVDFRNARILMIDISESEKRQSGKEIALDDLARNTVWMFLCQECWRRENHGEADTRKGTV